jgi:hypothetical protein
MDGWMFLVLLFNDDEPTFIYIKHMGMICPENVSHGEKVEIISKFSGGFV